MQINFARSIDPVFSQDITITRQAKTSEKRENAGNAEMGRKSIIYYGLYRAEGYISASLAQKVTGFSEGDLELFWKAVINMFENDRSAARCVCASFTYFNTIPFLEMRPRTLSLKK